MRIRHGWLVVMLAVSAVSACKKEGSESAAGAGAADKALSSDPVVAAGDDLSLLPSDSELVLGINVAQIQDSALWKQVAKAAMDNAMAQSNIGAVKEKCGFDPAASIKSVTVGMKGFAAQKPDGVIVIHGLDKAQSLACIDKMKTEIASNGTEITRDGDVTLAKSKEGETVAFQFVNSGTLIMVVGDKANAAGVKAVLSGGSKLKDSPAFVEMYSKVKTSDSLWFLLNGSVLAKAPGLETKPKGFAGSLNATDGLTLDARIKFESADVATKQAADLKTKSQMAVAMVDKIDFSSEGDTVKAAIVISNQKLQALVAQFGAMFGMHK
jgi:hypothetical protein